MGNVKKSRLLPEPHPGAEPTGSAAADDKKAPLARAGHRSRGLADDTEPSESHQQPPESAPDDSKSDRNYPSGDSNSEPNSSLEEFNSKDTMSWGYDETNGPDTWAQSFPDAGGKLQSPIDLSIEQAEFDPQLGALNISYAKEKKMEVLNTGLSFKMNISGDSTLTGGPLEGKFKLVQFHFHWGHNDKCGSEHRVEGQMYPAELHLVHYNTNKYKSFNDAVTQSDGLAVLGVFLKAGDKDHPGFQALVEKAGNVKCAGADCHCEDFNPECLLPENTKQYWTYQGSLTTPPCCESVKWIVLREEIEVSDAQLNRMRALCCDDCGSTPIPDNYRPPLPLGDRQLRVSFPKAMQKA